MSDELKKLRLSIDEQDRQIVAALCRRMELAEKIGEYKKRNALPVFVPEREDAVLESVRSLAGADYAADVSEIYRLILHFSRGRQEKEA